MNNTYQVLLHWDKGQAFAERISAKLLALEGFSELDPQSPVGGPDGTKDILCKRDAKKFVVGCYFPNGQKTFSEIEKKFAADYSGVAKHDAQGFVFMTNQKITPGERTNLVKKYPSSEIFHGERICNALDSPKGYGIRLEYLGVELTKAEQISFLDWHLGIKSQLEEMKQSLEEIKRVSVRMAGVVDAHDLATSRLGTPPIAGLPISSRLSVEDLHALHAACLYESAGSSFESLRGFRRIQTWIGLPGCNMEDAEFVPLPPHEVPKKLNELLAWWRQEYIDVVHADEDAKVRAIAQFHMRFLSIHPFTDGNGRVSRILASLHFQDLLSRQVSFEAIENKAEYYSALNAARQGGIQQLVDLLLSLTK